MSEIYEAIESILNNGTIPTRVTNRLLMATLLELVQRQERTEAAIHKLVERVDRVEQFPSILGLLWSHPKTTIAFIVMVFILLTLAYQAGAISLL